MTAVPSRRCCWRRMMLAAVLVVAALMARSPMTLFASTQAQSEVSITAALLYNFAKFTEWPGLPPAAPISICVVADAVMVNAVAAVVKGQQINGRSLGVSHPLDSTAWPACQVLFISGSELRNLAGALAAIATSPVLTVGDGRAFAQTGGIIELYVDGAKMRFAINISAADRAGLRISSRLLRLAKIVRSQDGS
jgi:hypothetical protein